MGAMDNAPVTEIQVNSPWLTTTVTACCVSWCWTCHCRYSLFHDIDQLRGSRESDEGRGMRAFSALPSSLKISVPGMSSVCVRSAILMVDRR